MTFNQYVLVSTVISLVIALALDYWAYCRGNIVLDSQMGVLNPLRIMYIFIVSFSIILLIGIKSPVVNEEENVHTIYTNEANASVIVSYDSSKDELKGGTITKQNKQMFVEHNDGIYSSRTIQKGFIPLSKGSIKLSKDNATVMRSVDDIVLKGKDTADYVSRIDYGTRTITRNILGFIPLKFDSMDIVNVYLVPHKVDNSKDKDNIGTLNDILDNNKR